VKSSQKITTKSAIGQRRIFPSRFRQTVVGTFRLTLMAAMVAFGTARPSPAWRGHGKSGKAQARRSRIEFTGKDVFADEEANHAGDPEG
jgi:hypothetical protein